MVGHVDVQITIAVVAVLASNLHYQFFSAIHADHVIGEENTPKCFFFIESEQDGRHATYGYSLRRDFTINPGVEFRNMLDEGCRVCFRRA